MKQASLPVLFNIHLSYALSSRLLTNCHVRTVCNVMLCTDQRAPAEYQVRLMPPVVLTYLISSPSSVSAGNKLFVTDEHSRKRLSKNLNHVFLINKKDTEFIFFWLQGYLSDDQLKALKAYRQLMNDRKQTQMQEQFKKALESAEQEENGCYKRDVSAVWKLYVVDYRKQEKYKG